MSQNSGQQPWAGQVNQGNNAAGGGNAYGVQGGNQYIYNSTAYNNNTVPVQRGLRMDTKVLLGTLLFDVAFFFYGMLAYTGKNTSGDNWRAGLFLFAFFMTFAMIGRWFRRRY